MDMEKTGILIRDGMYFTVVLSFEIPDEPVVFISIKFQVGKKKGESPRP